MADIWTKAELYIQVDKIRDKLHLRKAPIDSIALIKNVCVNPYVTTIGFESKSICGMLVKGQQSTYIGLNANHTPAQQNYYCAHEFIHYCYHGDDDLVLVCCDQISPGNMYSEWQANEGAAELLVPYRQFIPAITGLFCGYPDKKFKDLYGLLNELAYRHNVPKTTISNRIDTLAYEICQYTRGVPLDKLEIISAKEQKRRGISVKSYNDILREKYQSENTRRPTKQTQAHSSTVPMGNVPVRELQMPTPEQLKRLRRRKRMTGRIEVT